MRLSTLAVLPLLGALFYAPAPAAAQGISIRFGTRLGPQVNLTTYSADRYGDWRTGFRRWTPVTLYEVNGRYYRYQVRGARAILVYKYRNDYFLPPQDQGWRNHDRRYNYHRIPSDADYGRAQPYAAVTIDPRLGAEIGISDFSQDRIGNWQRNFRRWTPVTVYEVNGHYYTHNAAGARPVMVYRYGSEYFLPPDDPAWEGKDRRFNYDRKPTPDDRARLRGRP